MSGKDYGALLKLNAQLAELHDQNSFKVRSLSNAAYKIDKSGIDLDSVSPEDLGKIEGIGKGIVAKILEIRETGTTTEIKELLEATPPGVVEMLGIKGIGPKKVRQLWKELEVESPGELLYACFENRLLTLKGFGEKTQQQIQNAIEFRNSNQGKFWYADCEDAFQEAQKTIKEKFPNARVENVGGFFRKDEVVTHLEFLVLGTENKQIEFALEGIPVKVQVFPEEKFDSEYFAATATTEFLESINFKPFSGKKTEDQIFEELKISPVPAEWRDRPYLSGHSAYSGNLISFEMLKGSLHNHSTWSDGINTLEEMAQFCQSQSWEYLGICDHSKSAFYANGLSIERVAEQHKEIEALNKKKAPFRIFKGIESDILNDGSLDYPEEVLKSFDFVVASVHSNLKMDIEKATSRLIKAIENPYTTILGHPTGRLLLSRPGYPIDTKKVIDACAANGVVIELNSHPWRLDIDWRHIPYCLEKGVMISLNPDAHVKEGLLDMKYGVFVARKGGLDAAHCLNAKPVDELEKLFKRKKE
jgi:DNA polymerase (family X)